ncbi:hypothetical protein ACGE24_00525 [Corynebacterium kroppenstedtii]
MNSNPSLAQPAQRSRVRETVTVAAISVVSVVAALSAADTTSDDAG